MLKIIEIGMFACDHCDTKNKQKGVEFESFGSAIKPTMVAKKPDGSREVTSAGLHYVWREQLHLCLKHFGSHLAEMIDFGETGTWGIHKQAAMRRDFVNTTYGVAEKNNFWRHKKD